MAKALEIKVSGVDEAIRMVGTLPENVPNASRAFHEEAY